MQKLKTRFFGILLSSMFFAVPQLMAQTVKAPITGEVVDVNGEPLIGVSIQVKGTTTGTVTDVNGKFTLPPLSVKNPTLLFSYIGYETQDKMYDGKPLRIQLVENNKNLEQFP